MTFRINDEDGKILGTFIDEQYLKFTYAHRPKSQNESCDFLTFLKGTMLPFMATNDQGDEVTKKMRNFVNSLYGPLTSVPYGTSYQKQNLKKCIQALLCLSKAISKELLTHIVYHLVEIYSSDEADENHIESILSNFNWPTDTQDLKLELRIAQQECECEGLSPRDNIIDLINLQFRSRQKSIFCVNDTLSRAENFVGTLSVQEREHLQRLSVEALKDDVDFHRFRKLFHQGPQTASVYSPSSSHNQNSDLELFDGGSSGNCAQSTAVLPSDETTEMPIEETNNPSTSKINSHSPPFDHSDTESHQLTCSDVDSNEITISSDSSDDDFQSKLAKKQTLHKKRPLKVLSPSTKGNDKQKSEQKTKRKKGAWTIEEEDNLVRGVLKYGNHRWTIIRRHFDLMHKGSQQLYDKYRNMKKFGHLEKIKMRIKRVKLMNV